MTRVSYDQRYAHLKINKTIALLENYGLSKLFEHLTLSYAHLEIIFTRFLVEIVVNFYFGKK